MQQVINEWHDGLAGFAELEEVAGPDAIMEQLCAEQAAAGGVTDFGLLFDVDADVVVPQPSSKRRRVGSGAAARGSGGADSSAANTSPSGGMGAAGAPTGEAGGSGFSGGGAVADTGGDATMMAFETLLQQGSTFDFDLVMPAADDDGGGGGGGWSTDPVVPHSVPYSATAGGPPRDPFAGLSWDCGSSTGSGGDVCSSSSPTSSRVRTFHAGAGAGGARSAAAAAAAAGGGRDLGLVRADFDDHAEELRSSAVVQDAVVALLGCVRHIAGSHKPLRSVHPWPMKLLLWHYLSQPAAVRPTNVLDAAKRAYAAAWETAVGVKFEEPVGERWAQEMQRVVTAGGGFFTTQWRGGAGPEHFAIGFQEADGAVTAICWIIPFALLTTLMKTVWSHRFSSRRILESVLRQGTNWAEVPFYTRDVVALAAAAANGRSAPSFVSERGSSDVDS